jgi:transketolase
LPEIVTRLGSDDLFAGAEVLVENHPMPMKRICVRDTFAESGPYLALLEKYGLSAPHITEAVRGAVARKG